MEPILTSFLAFLKYFTLGAGITLSTKVTSDIYKAGGFETIGKVLNIRMAQKVKGYTMENEHVTVMGMTQYGKTYATLKTLEGLKEGVLFINPQQTKVPKSFIKATMENSAGDIWRVVKMGKKVNYETSDNLEVISMEIGRLIDGLYKIGKLDCRVVIDECHLLSLSKDKSGLNAGKRLASTGLSRGFKTVFISQRPATVDNSFYTQSTRHILFNLGLNDYEYLSQKGFPVNEIKEKTYGKKYVFVEFDQMFVKGAYTIE